MSAGSNSHMTDPITRLNSALEGRYRVEREIGAGGTAVVHEPTGEAIMNTHSSSSYPDATLLLWPRLSRCVLAVSLCR